MRRIPAKLGLPWVLLAALLTFVPASGQEGIVLPDIGDSSGAIVSQQDEQEYGEALYREFRRLAHIIDDPMVDEYIRHLGYSLVAYSDNPERSFTFFVVDDRSVNAFAAPGGFIGIHTGLILRADNESELAAVMAHEVAHVTQRHLARAIESAQRVSLPMMLLMLGAAVAGAGDVDAMQTALVGGQALMAQMQINFTRANEYEADRVGIKILANAGYDTAGMAGFFSEMAKVSRNYGGGPPEFLRTHPVETTRIAEAKNRADQVVVTDAPDRSRSDFLYIKERIRVLDAERSEPVTTYYVELAEKRPLTPAEKYGKALALILAKDPVGAYELLDEVARLDPDSLPVKLALARVEILSGHGEEGAERFRELADRYPSNRAVMSAYAEELLKAGGPARARQAEALLRPIILRNEADATLYLLYSRAADQSGNPVRAQAAFAEATYRQGKVYDAVTQLENLLESPDLDYYQRSRVEARLAELQPILARIQRERSWDPSEGNRPRSLTFRSN